MGRSERWQYRSIYLTRRALDRLAEDLGVEEVPYFTRNTFTDRDLIDAFLAMHLAMEEGRDVFRERELLVGSLRPPVPAPRQRPHRIRRRRATASLLARVIERMRPNTPPTCASRIWPPSVGLTTFQLIGLFKRTVGLTPHAYLTQVRLGMACRHLRHAPVLAEVATAVGFYDQSALNKHFKRCYGITPLQFARAAAA